MEEKWKTIVKYPKYEVSNLGNVRNAENKRVMRHQVTQYGQAWVGISVNGKNRSLCVAQAVLETFNPRDDMKSLYVKYKDNDRKNCRLDNLEWSEKPMRRMNREIFLAGYSELERMIQDSIRTTIIAWLNKQETDIQPNPDNDNINII